MKTQRVKKYNKRKSKINRKKNKTKKLNIKKIKNLRKILGGNRYIKYREGQQVNTIRNNGKLEGMTNQCFWISILHYLRLNNISPNITLKQIRKEAGLSEETENTMFDDNSDIFINAVNKIIKKYSLVIHSYQVDRDGIITNFGNIYPSTITDAIVNGKKYDDLYKRKNIVDIVNFGEDHFELIDDNGEKFEPAVSVNNKITKISEVDHQLKQVYLDISEKKGLVDIIYQQLELDKNTVRKKIEEQNGFKTSNDLREEEKKKYLREYESEINYLKNEINVKEKYITNLNNEISSLELAIQLEKSTI